MIILLRYFQPTIGSPTNDPMEPNGRQNRASRHAYLREAGSTAFAILALLCAMFWQTRSHALGENIDLSEEFIIAADVTPAGSDTLNPGKPAMGFDGTNHLVVSCREEDSSASIFGVLVSPDGAVLSSFPIVDLNLPAFGCSLKRPSVAFDGSNYLVVFSQRTGSGSLDIFGARVTPSGVVLDGPSGFHIFSDVSDEAVVAFDGSNYLVVSVKFNDDTLHDIFGARVDTAGQVLDEFPIFIAPGGQVFSSIAFDGVNYLVIWSDTRSGSPVGPDADIYGTRITPSGTVVDPEGLPISTAPGIQEWPHIIFDGNNFFAVWEDTRNDPDVFPPIIDIFGTRITSDGALLDGPSDTGGIAISAHPLPQQHPVASFNGAEYFVAWEMSYSLDPPEGIFAARVSTDGFLIDGPPDAGGILISDPDTFDSRLVWPTSHFNGSNLLLGWINNREVSGTFKDVVGVLISHISDILEVEIDIKPGNKRNLINSSAKGGVWVALLSDTDPESPIDPPSQIDISTVEFGPDGAKAVRGNVKDINKDGLGDLLLRFRIPETGIACVDTEATLIGETFDGQSITGTDSVETVGCKKAKKTEKKRNKEK